MLRRTIVPSVLLALVCACSPEPAATPKTWSVVMENLPGALLSVWGTSSKDVWTVGGGDPKHPETGPQVLHWDGKAWTMLKTGVPGNLAWVTHGATDDELWMVGFDGLILRYLRSTNKFVQLPSNTKQWLWGVAVPDATDGWAVGGAPGCVGDTGGVVLHWDGTAWGATPGLDTTLQNSTACWFKVFARAKNDVWIVGTGGHILHYDGTTWKAMDSGQSSKATLLTVSGNANLVIAVGGMGEGSIVENSGNGFVEKIPTGLQQLNGVFVEANGDAVAVGGAGMGTVWQRKGGTWTQMSGTPEISQDFHGTWVDPDGGIWAVGGNLMTVPQTGGILAHFGASQPASFTP